MRLKAKRRAGFTLVETALTIGLFAGLLAVFSLSLRGNAKGQDLALAQEAMLESAEEALQEIRSLLGRTQITSAYPQVFDGNTVGVTFPSLAHAAANLAPGLPTPRELVFPVAEDVDGDSWPDVSGSGEIVWQTTPSVLALVGEANGSNTLCLLSQGGRRRDLATRVASVVFDTSTSSGFAIPLNTLRVRITMIPATASGPQVPSTFEAMMPLSRQEDLP